MRRKGQSARSEQFCLRQRATMLAIVASVEAAVQVLIDPFKLTRLGRDVLTELLKD
jgi:hypothetical protein